MSPVRSAENSDLSTSRQQRRAPVVCACCFIAQGTGSAKKELTASFAAAASDMPQLALLLTNLLRSAQRREQFARARHLKPSLNWDFLP